MSHSIYKFLKRKQGQKMLDDCNLPPKKRMEAMNIDHQIVELAADEKRSSLSFCDLPVEILLEIFEKMDKSQHMAMRATSKYLRDFSDNFIMNEFQKALSKSCATNEYCLKNETILIIKNATELYLHAGYESMFCGSILHILNFPTVTTQLCADPSNIYNFLFHFYNVVEFSCGGPQSQLSQLLQNLTLIRLLKTDDRFITKSSTKLRSRWVGQIELRGYCFDNEWAKPINRKRLLASISTKDYYYYYGRRYFERKGSISFSFTVIGSDEICSIFRSCLEDELDEFSWPAILPEDRFKFNLDIRRNEAYNDWLDDVEIEDNVE